MFVSSDPSTETNSLQVHPPTAAAADAVGVGVGSGVEAEVAGVADPTQYDIVKGVPQPAELSV
jgi:hypothetical protein